MTHNPTKSHTLKIAGLIVLLALTNACATVRPLALTPAKQTEKQLDGQVTYIYDGDTVLVEDANRQKLKVRLKGIDAPEKTQAYGPQAARRLTELVLNRQVEVFWEETDRYGRILGKVTSGRTDFCLEMIASGLAWHFTRYEQSQSASDRTLYRQTEKESRDHHKGLWEDANPTPPWEYRQQQRNEQKFELMNTNDKNNGGPKTDDERVELTLAEMQQAEALHALNDLELIDLIISAPISDDPRVYELLTRLNPNWTTDLADGKQEPTPSYISLSIPIAVAYDEMAYDHCRCRGPEPAPDNSSPCIFCACRAALYSATRNSDFQPPNQT